MIEYVQAKVLRRASTARARRKSKVLEREKVTGDFEMYIYWRFLQPAASAGSDGRMAGRVRGGDGHMSIEVAGKGKRGPWVGLCNQFEWVRSTTRP